MNNLFASVRDFARCLLAMSGFSGHDLLRGFRARTLGAFVIFSLMSCLPATSIGGDIVNLGVLSGDDYSIAYAISGNGSTVVGASADGFGERGFRWTSGGGMADLGSLGQALTNALGVSADGSVVIGYGQNLSFEPRAFRWTQVGGIENLGVLTGGTSSLGYGVSGDGLTIVGEGDAAGSNGNPRAFKWTSVGGMVNLGVLAGGNSSSAQGANADGSVIVGKSNVTNSGTDRAFRWTESGGMVNLGQLSPSGFSIARATNANGSVVVGQGSLTVNNQLRAFRWTESGGLVNLGQLPGVTNPNAASNAVAVNADGTMVVGFATNQTDELRAMLWTQALGMVDLNTYLPAQGVNLTGWTLQSAWGISADGTRITGMGTYLGETRAFLVTVPEPSTYILGTIAAGTMTWVARRRKRRLAVAITH